MSEVFTKPNVSQAKHRYAAACAAALAGCGRGDDAAILTDADRARWREQAREWLTDDLDSCQKQLQFGGKNQPDVEHTLSVRSASADLACVRDTGALARLPAEERERWTELWQRVTDLMGHVHGK